MSDNTKIEWTDATWNPITGCSRASEGCRHCYAALLAATRLKHHPSREGLAAIDGKGEAKFTGEVRFNEQWLDQPLRWRRPRMIFVCAHGDLFHENVPDEWIDRVFAVMALAPQHTFQVLTKRSDRMREYFLGDLVREQEIGQAVHELNQELARPLADPLAGLHLPLPNVWLGVSVEDQAAADARREDFANTPSAIKFVSYEPALGPVDWTGWEFVDQIISGGESGPKARPSHPDWHRSPRDFCAGHGIAYFFKQWGEWGPDTGPQDQGPPYRDRVMDGGGPCAVLVDGQWQEYPNGYAVPIELCRGHGEFVYRFSKRFNGRLLDGVTHDAMPGHAA